MEKRLIAQGPKDRQSFTLTLPLEWIKDNKLDSRKTVDVKIVSNKCIISALKDETESIKFNSKIFKKVFLKTLPILYKMGIDEIKVENADPSSIKDISNIVETKLIGYEILEQNHESILIKDISGESIKDFDNVFRRLYLLLLELSKNDEPENVLNLSKNIEKLANYCQRIIIKNPTEYQRHAFFFSFLSTLEKISDEYKWLFMSAKLEKDRLKMLAEVNECFRKSYELFFRFDSKTYVEYQYKTYELKNKFKITKNIDIQLLHLHNLARQLNSLYGDLFALKFN